jgi:hypothetical protein
MLHHLPVPPEIKSYDIQKTAKGVDFEVNSKTSLIFNKTTAQRISFEMSVFF